MFYYYKNHYISQGKLYCVYQSDHRLTEEEIEEIHKGQPELLDDTTVYEGTEPFTGYPIKDRDTIRPASDRELIELNKLKLGEGEILVGDNISKVPQPNWQYKWDYVLLKWIPNEKKLEEGQYISEDKIITVPKLENALVQEWNNSTHTWEDKTTVLDTAQAQFNEYKPLDTPLTLMDLEEQGLKTEYVNMMQELKRIIIQLKNTPYSTGYAVINVPAISKELREFKENFKKIGG